MDEEKKVKMLSDRQGWFWPEMLLEGKTYTLPADVAEYLIEVGAAKIMNTRKRSVKGSK